MIASQISGKGHTYKDLRGVNKEEDYEPKPLELELVWSPISSYISVWYKTATIA